MPDTKTDAQGVPEGVGVLRHGTATSRLVRLLEEWVPGGVVNHFPITASLGSVAAFSYDTAWGCSICGKGWPCLTVRTARTLRDLRSIQQTSLSLSEIRDANSYTIFRPDCCHELRGHPSTSPPSHPRIRKRSS